MSYSCKEPSRTQEDGVGVGGGGSGGGGGVTKKKGEKNDNTAQEYSTAW